MFLPLDSPSTLVIYPLSIVTFINKFFALTSLSNLAASFLNCLFSAFSLFAGEEFFANAPRLPDFLLLFLIH